MHKSGKKSASGRASKTPVASERSQNVLDRMSPSELATVLQTFLKAHPDLVSEAEAIAINIISCPLVEDVADEVNDAVMSLGIEDFHGRTGRQPGGYYVEPTEAAWELLEESIHEVVADMKRRAAMGLDEAAESLCRGIVVGLSRCDGTGSEGPLGWAPDFPAQHACYAVTELVRSCPGEKRAAIRDRLVQALGDLVPHWHEMLSRAAERAMQK